MKMETPNYVLTFNDGFMSPQKESIAKDIVSYMLVLSGILMLAVAIFFGLEALKEIPVTVWLCLAVGIMYLVSQGGCVRCPSPCELWFYDEYLVQYCERRYYSKRNIRKEYYKFFYKDITKCVYRTEVKKFDIYGVVEATFYKYDKNGNVGAVPCKHLKAEAVSVFYTVFEPTIDFVDEIEMHSPIRIEYHMN